MHEVHEFLNSSFFTEIFNYILLIKIALWHCCVCNRSVNEKCTESLVSDNDDDSKGSWSSGSLGLWFLVVIELWPLAGGLMETFSISPPILLKRN